MELTEKGQKTVKAVRNVVIFIALLGAAYFGYKKWGGDSGKIAVDGKSGKPDLVVAYNTFTGVEGLVLENGGMEPNDLGLLLGL